VKISLLKYIDKTFGTVLVRLIRPPRSQTCSAPNNILILRPGGIGDAIHLVPAINLIKETFPSTTIKVLAEKRNGAAFSLCPVLLNEVLLYDTLGGIWKALHGRYDAVIDTEQWHCLSAVVARVTRAPLLVGYATNERKRLFSHAIPYFHEDYEAENFFNLVGPLGVEKTVDVKVPFLKVPTEVTGCVGRILGGYCEQPFVAIFPGASIPERRWGAEKFRGVAELLHAQGLRVVVVGGKEEVVDGDKIVSGNSGLNLAGKTSLIETAAVIARSALLVSGDSGILHIGAGLGKPTVSLFGPGIARKWAPRGENHIVINKNLPCSPCTKFGYTPQCPINARCMAEISVEEVTAAVLDLFEKHGKRT
jgi:ADP-heptose:LPS heptosyltransferase